MVYVNDVAVVYVNDAADDWAGDAPGTNRACAGLDERGVTRVVLTGAATEVCVAQAGIAARASGYQVTVLRDACATVDAENEQISLAYLEHVTGSVIRDAIALAGISLTGRSC